MKMATVAVRRLTTAASAPKLADLVPRVVDAARTSPPTSPLPTVDPHALSLRTLMAAGLHLGHKQTEWNPRMLPYIYGTRQDIHIINLEHTLAALRRASAFVRQVALAGGNIVFLGTKPSLHKIVFEAANICNGFFMLHWTGGTITNKERVLRYSTGYDPSRVIQQLKAAATSLTMDASESGDADHESDQLADQDAAADLMNDLPSGIRKQPYVHQPDVIIALDYVNNLWAVREANQSLVPVIAVCDTNTDPSLVSYPIPANDDSITGIKLIAGVLARAAAEGTNQRHRQLRNH